MDFLIRSGSDPRTVRAFRTSPDALQQGNLSDAFIAEGAAADSLKKLQNGALCVTTGQQPGYLWSPLYSLHKAITAVVLAKKLTSELGRDVVPVFWVAGDDHDHIEASLARFVDHAGTVKELRHSLPESVNDSLPMYRYPVGPMAKTDAQTALKWSGPASFSDEAMKLVERCYHPDSNLADAFAQGIASILGDHGLLVFKPWAESAKANAAPIIRAALEQSAELGDALLADSEHIKSEGRFPQVSVDDPQATLVMIEGIEGRDRIIRKGDSFVTRRSGETFSSDQLMKLLESEPGRFSANVLLRPVVEASILPTITYIGGPSELKYFEQTEPVYRALGVEAQGALSRWSALIVEPRIRHLLSKLDIDLDALEGDQSNIERQFLMKDLPEGTAAQLEEMRRAIADGSDALATAASDIDTTLIARMERYGLTAMRQIDAAESKLKRHLRMKSDTRLGQLRRIRSALQPDGNPQERALGLLPLLARYDRGFIPPLLNEAARWIDRLESESPNP